MKTTSGFSAPFWKMAAGDEIVQGDSEQPKTVEKSRRLLTTA